MPNIVKAGGVHMTENVFRITDVTSRQKRTKPPSEPEKEFSNEPFVIKELDSAPEADEPADMSEPLPEDTDYVEHAVPQVQGEIIKGAMAEASRILENAIREAEEQKAEILGQIQAEAEQIRRDAADQGRNEGLNAIIGDVKGTTQQIEQAIANFEGDRAGFEAEYEEQLKWLAMEIASKVLAKKVSQDDTEMVEMVDKAVHSVQNEPWIRVEVAQEMTRLIGRLIELYEGQANIEVSPVPAEPGTVHIETPSGVIDASLLTQLENLKGYFEQSAQ